MKISGQVSAWITSNYRISYCIKILYKSFTICVSHKKLWCFYCRIKLCEHSQRKIAPGWPSMVKWFPVYLFYVLLRSISEGFLFNRISIF